AQGKQSNNKQQSDHTMTTGEVTPSISTMDLIQDRGKHIGRYLTLPQQPNETDQYNHNMNNLACHNTAKYPNQNHLVTNNRSIIQTTPECTPNKNYRQLEPTTQIHDSQEPGPSKLYSAEKISQILKALRNEYNQETNTNTSQEEEPTTFLDCEDHSTTSKGKRPLKGQARIKRTKASTPNLQLIPNRLPHDSSNGPTQQPHITNANRKRKSTTTTTTTSPSKHKKLKNKETIKLNSMPSHTAQVHNTSTRILHTFASLRVTINKSPALNTTTLNKRQTTGHTNTNFRPNDTRYPLLTGIVPKESTIQTSSPCSSGKQQPIDHLFNHTIITELLQHKQGYIQLI
ncbi:hypothetical protein CHS0354_032779, partial [Potamilus streckersoni]